MEKSKIVKIREEIHQKVKKEQRKKEIALRMKLTFQSVLENLIEAGIKNG